MHVGVSLRDHRATGKLRPHKELTMSDWIDEEVNRIGEGIEDANRKAERDSRISQQGHWFWQN
jgi:hypothetical protein